MKTGSNMFSKKAVIVSTIVAALVSAASMAKAQVLTFEGLQNQEPIDNYYNGGLGGLGSGPGPNYGITFTSDSLAIIANSAGGTGNFEDNPSGNTIAFFLSGVGDTMNAASGFNTGFSFYYSALDAGSVTVWSGLNGTGTELANIALNPTGNNGPSGAQYNVWDAIGVNFSGTAESAIFSGSANFIGFDDITLGSATAGTVPDNGGYVTDMIAGLSLAGAGFLARKKMVCA
jgi:hypothetical protein